MVCIPPSVDLLLFLFFSYTFFCLFFVVITYTVIWYLNFYIKFKKYYLESIFIKGGLIIRCILIHHNQQQTNISKLIGEKKASSTNGTVLPGCKYMTSYTKLKSRWINDLNINPDKLNLKEKKVGNSLEHIGTRDNFINRTPIELTLRSRINT